ncbi:glycosyltransferase family 4 protein [Lysobacter enzymogenes]|uniref:glycosyltransferase family 4 protein n=1 Tax=Lysobacter enzymogenes TaxID=69 RepID=UPI00385176B2
MKIAQISPLYEAVPPRLYGGTERVVAHLCDALVEAGHEVTLFATADADTRAELAPVRAGAIRLDRAGFASATANLAAHLSLMHEVRRRADEFDLLHFHVDLLHFPFFEDCAGRTLTTLHGRLDHPDMAPAYKRWAGYPLVSISDHQRRPLPRAHWLGTVYHGLPPDLLACTPRPAGGYLAFLGRISPEKRVDRAIEIARRAGYPLRIAAKVDRADREYFHDTIEPLLDAPGIEFVGEIGDADKAEFLGQADALLFPIDWPEPFGLVMIEAMACGTPVIAWNCGSVPEVIDEGVTGAVVDSIDAAVAAVRDLRAFDRERVRAVFERRFSAAAMAHDYLDLYARLAGRDGRPLRLSA